MRPLHRCIHCTCLSILCWLKTEQGCGTFKGGKRDSKVGQSKNIFNNYSWYPAYLYHTSTLRKKSASRCSVGRQSGDNKIRKSGRHFRRESPGIKSENSEWRVGTLFTYFDLACDEVWVPCTEYILQCVLCKHFLWCSMLNFSNVCSAVVSKPPTKHQHCTHQCKMTAKSGWIKH